MIEGDYEMQANKVSRNIKISGVAKLINMRTRRSVCFSFIQRINNCLIPDWS